MYVSPTRVFCRSIALVSSAIGANSGSISIVTRVALPSGGSSSSFTDPTVTPLTRTSDSSASVAASGKSAVIR